MNIEVHGFNYILYTYHRSGTYCEKIYCYLAKKGRKRIKIHFMQHLYFHKNTNEKLLVKLLNMFRTLNFS